ncbi:MAG: phage major tail protein, TP901-1 family [Alphaproteobacteria bacterium]|nr:phage major tail protein, TP901-1 family [Alphaproteobacteria bacterium]
MAAQQGRALLLKKGSGSGSPETFDTVAGLRTKTVSLNAESVDITNADSSGAWRELLADGGVRSARLSGAGVFKDEAADEAVRLSFFTQTIGNWQAVIPDFGTLEGPFQIVALEYGGAHDGEVTVSLTLESAGALTFTAL